jgi:hypothetical protein
VWVYTRVQTYKKNIQNEIQAVYYENPHFKPGVDYNTHVHCDTVAGRKGRRMRRTPRSRQLERVEWTRPHWIEVRHTVSHTHTHWKRHTHTLAQSLHHITTVRVKRDGLGGVFLVGLVNKTDIVPHIDQVHIWDRESERIGTQGHVRGVNFELWLFKY